MARCRGFLLKTDNVVPEHTADLVVAAHLSMRALKTEVEHRSMPGGVGLGSSHPKRHGVPHPSRTFLGSHARCTDVLDAISSFLLVVWVCGSVSFFPRCINCIGLVLCSRTSCFPVIF